jgi:hypothetical protein
LPGLVGYEADQVTADSPANVVILAETPVVTQYSSGFHHMTVYSNPSGAVIFATGSVQWAWGLDGLFAGQIHANVVSPAAQQVMRNVMARFAV